MKTKIFTLFSIVVLVSMVFGFAQSPEPGQLPVAPELTFEAEMARVPGTFDAAEHSRTQELLANRLLSDAAPLSPEALISVSVTAEDMARIESYQCESCGEYKKQNNKLMVGVSKSVGVLTPQTHGVMHHNIAGELVWTMAFEAAAATALRVHVQGMDLPEGARLYAYTDQGEAHGPFSATGPNKDGDFWTTATAGAICYVQVHAEAGIGLAELRLSLTEVAYLGDKLVAELKKHQRRQNELDDVMAHCSNNASCVEDAACYGTSDFAGYNNVTNGVACLLFQKSGSWYLCSGGLLNSSPYTGKPYFLTANHCIPNQTVANTMQTYFFFKNSSCGQNPCVTRGSYNTNGATLHSTSATSDYAFLELSGSAPGGSVLLGWSTQDVAYANGTMLYRLSHPAGSPQAFSKHRVDTGRSTCGSWPRGNWIYETDTFGGTQGGSSGSPICLSDGKVVGQLSGSCGLFPSLNCWPSINATVDGAFRPYFCNIKQWLCPSCACP